MKLSLSFPFAFPQLLLEDIDDICVEYKTLLSVYVVEKNDCRAQPAWFDFIILV